jgi:hypothetical protein
MFYQIAINQILSAANIKANPRHVEAWIRSECSTLDRLTASELKKLAIDAAQCADEAGEAFSEKLAQSFGI